MPTPRLKNGTHSPRPPEARTKSRIPTYLSAVDGIGPAMKKWRVSVGFSQERVAADLSTRLNEKVSQSYVAHTENGDCMLSLTRFLAMCDVLSADPSELISKAGGLINAATA